MEASDTQLMEAVRAGDLGRLGELFERHHRRLYLYCRRLSGDAAAAEDLVQEIFMRLLRYRESYRPDAEFAPWLYTLARHACLDHLRRAPAGMVSDTDLGEPASPAPGAEADAAGREAARLLQRAFRRLPDKERELLVLARLEGRRYQEIAAVLGCSVGAVKVRVHRAVRKLHDLYAELAGEAA